MISKEIPIGSETVIELENSAFNYRKLLFATSGIDKPVCSIIPVFNAAKYEISGYDPITGIPKDEYIDTFYGVGYIQKSKDNITESELIIYTIELGIDLMNPNRLIFEPNYLKTYSLSQGGIIISNAQGKAIREIYGEI